MINKIRVLFVTFLFFSSLVYAIDDKIDTKDSDSKEPEKGHYTIYQEIDKQSVNPQVYGELGSPYSPTLYRGYYPYYGSGYGYRYNNYDY